MKTPLLMVLGGNATICRLVLNFNVLSYYYIILGITLLYLLVIVL